MNLRDLEKAATPAPWRQGHASLLTHVICDADLYAGATVATVNFTSQNAALIAALRNAAPLLLDVVDAARAILPENLAAACGSIIAVADGIAVLKCKADKWTEFRAALAALDAL